MEWTEEQDILIIESSFKDLVDNIRQFSPHVCLESVHRAFSFANVAHYGQRRHSGEPYITHPLEVAKILAELRLDTSTITCALMHDVVEDTSYTIQDIEDRFSKTEAIIIDGLTKIHKLEVNNVSFNKVENFRRLLMAVANDARVLLIKLADRLHNMRTLESVGNYRKKLRIAKETIDVYAPLADRIGMHFFKNLLYDMSFEVLYPNLKHSIVTEIEKLKIIGIDIINRIINDINTVLRRAGIKCNLYGREKSPFSIWQKMEKKHVHFDQLSDIFAIRIIARTMLDCYTILGVIHTSFRVVPSEFIDYISTPKNNGYQSLHTVIFIDDQIRVEVQIRTVEMHQFSELGMAAHWLYKDSTHDNEHHLEWLCRIRTILENINDTNDVITNVRLEMYSDQVLCFTPAGDVVILPHDATPLDFAFEVNLQLGSHYNKALVNGIPVKITTPLKSGDQVEILTSDQVMINNNWVDLVKTAKAKSEIQVYLNKKSFEVLVNAGKLSIHEECEKKQLKITDHRLEKVAEEFHTSISDLLFKIGNRSISIEEVLSRLSGESLYSRIQRYFKKYILKNTSNQSFITLGDLKKIAEIHFSYCCDPMLGKTACGIWNKRHNFVVVHSSLCYNMGAPGYEEEVCHIIVSESPVTNLEMTIEIITSELENPDVIFNVITDFGLSKYSIDIDRIEDDLIFLRLNLKLIVSQQVESLINKLKQLPNVIDISIL